MKTHILYIGLALTVLVIGLLAGSHLPAGIENQPVKSQPVVVPDLLAPSPLPSQPPKLRATLQGQVAAAFTADGKTLACAWNEDAYGDGYGKGEVKLWDVATAKERTSFQLAGSIYSLAFAADGTTLAVAYRWVTKTEGPAWKLKLWDVASGKERPLSEDPTFLVRAVAFAPDAKTLALAGSSYRFHEYGATELGGGAVKLWDVAANKERACLKHVERVHRVTFAADGKILASVRTSGAIDLWDLPAGQQRDALPFASGGFNALELTADGKTVVGGGPGIVVWDAVMGQELAALKAHQNGVESLALTADGKTLASAAPYVDVKAQQQLGEVKLWDVPSRRVWATLKGFPVPPRSMAFAPDGKILATVAGRELRLWDMPASK